MMVAIDKKRYGFVSFWSLFAPLWSTIPEKPRIMCIEDAIRLITMEKFDEKASLLFEWTAFYVEQVTILRVKPAHR